MASRNSASCGNAQAYLQAKPPTPSFQSQAEFGMPQTICKLRSSVASCQVSLRKDRGRQYSQDPIHAALLAFESSSRFVSSLVEEGTRSPEARTMWKASHL